MSKRTPPDDDDWTRRYLRRLKVPCEGEQLQAALDSLDARTWRRMKDAWRQRSFHRHGPMARFIEWQWCQGQKRFGAVWDRLLAWGVVSEEEAHLLASQPLGDTKTLKNLYGDVGACALLRLALGQMLDSLRREPAP